MTVASYADVLRQNPDFVKEGHHFDHWSTDAVGEVRIEEGAALDVTDGTPMIYANWAVNTHTLRFFANGGKFTDSAVFKDEEHFTIETDRSGGEVAVFEPPVAWGTRLSDIATSFGAPSTFWSKANDQVTRGYFTVKKTSGWITSYRW